MFAILLPFTAQLMQSPARAQEDRPGAVHRVPATLPLLHATASASRSARIIDPPAGAAPLAPPGFTVSEFASGLRTPRTLRTAPNGDIFVAESEAGRLVVYHMPPGATRPVASVFASGLTLPFGIGFWPPGPSPRFVYVAETNRVVRFPYTDGATRADGPAEIIVPQLPAGGHWTRDLVFDPEGSTMFVSVGSGSDVATELMGKPPAGLPTGAAWGEEADRATVLAFDPAGTDKRIYATGLRNCSAMAVQPDAGPLWCVVNERDGLGDDLPPDFATAVRPGEFYGWPWYYIGTHADPRFEGARRDLARLVRAPDVLIQAHSAPLGIAFYDAASFPPDYRGDAFVALHGSWNRASPTGYKVVRLRFHQGEPTGDYEDFLTGFTAPGRAVWGRPVGVTVAADGALLVSEDANGTIWRVAYTGTR